MADDAQAVAEQSVQQFMSSDAWAASLGMTVSDVAPGQVSVHVTVTDQMVNGHSSTHGGLLFSLADVAFAMACNSHAHDAVARSCSIEYLAPSFAAEAITATAIERALAGRNGIYDVAVTRDSDGQLLAELRGHSRRIDKPPAAPAR